jgi:Ca-activated chloride channel family protein
MGLGEDVEVSIRRLLARTTAPLITDVELSGDALVMQAPQRLPDVYSGAPALLSMKLRASGGRVTVRGRTAQGDFEETVEVPAVDRAFGSRSVATLFARELVEDLETQRVLEPGHTVDAAVTAIGLDFQISTRLTSWVAISEQMTVDPRLARRNVTQPQELAYGMSAEGLGLRSAAAPLVVGAMQGSGMNMNRTFSRPSAAPRGGAPERDEAAKEVSTERLRSRDVFADESADESDSESDSEAGAIDDIDEPSMEPQVTGRAEAPRSLKGLSGNAPAAPPKPAPMKAPEPAQKKKGLGLSDLVDKLVKVIGGGGKRITGRILRQHGTRLDIEIVLDAQLDWVPHKDAVIELANGTTVKAQVNFSFTTSNGVYGPGLLLTLTLTTPGELQQPVRVQLVSSGQNVEVTLSTP